LEKIDDLVHSVDRSRESATQLMSSRIFCCPLSTETRNRNVQ
jgi:hypothetical protein